MDKVKSMAKARAIKTQRVKEKIQGAINILNLYSNKKITIRAIATEAGVSKSTVQKYISEKKDEKFTEDTPIKVPFEEKEEVKKIGAYWNNEIKSWIAPAGASKKPFAKWF